MDSSLRRISADQQRQVITACRQTLDRLSQYYGKALALPPVSFELRGVRAGVFERVKGVCRIRFNATIFSENFSACIEQTVPHELAHYAVYSHYGRWVKPHGTEWRRAMAALGVEPLTRHNFDVSNARVRRQRRIDYRCPWRTHQLTVTRHNRVMRGLGSYQCVCCGGTLVCAE